MPLYACLAWRVPGAYRHLQHLQIFGVIHDMVWLCCLLCTHRPQGAFLAPDGGSLNYGAVLDTAADIAKALVHMHRQGVVHSDLKARCVQLLCLVSLGGACGRLGAACVCLDWKGAVA